MSKNERMLKAKDTKFDEYFTEYRAISTEIPHYREHLKGKIIYCNCDDPVYSNFWRYFHNNFSSLGIKKLISTHYVKDSEPSYKIEYTGGDDFNMDAGKVTQIVGDGEYTAGDFRSKDCIKLLKEADIVITNPPFSLFNEYIKQLLEYNKKFIIIGKMSAINNNDLFPLLKDNKIWTGYKSFGGGMDMIVPKEYFDESKVKKYIVNAEGQFIVNIEGVIWYTNIDTSIRHDGLWHKNGELDKTQAHRYYEGNEDNYPKYYNFDGIDVDSIANIPIDYEGYIGVPITIMEKFNPEEIELIGTGSSVKKKYIHTVTEKKKTISYVDKNGNIVWSTPYSVPERKLGNGLRIMGIDGKPANSPFSRLIIRIINPIKKDDDLGY